MRSTIAQTASAAVLTIMLGTTSVLITAMTSFAEDKVVAKIAGMEITDADLGIVEKEMAQQLAAVPEDSRKSEALRALIDIKLMAKKAEEEGVADSDAFKAQLKYQRERMLHNEYFQDSVSKDISDEAVKARYEKEIAAMPPTKEVKARHILVKTEEEAKAIIKELDGGKDFAEVAKEKSTGPSGPKGGDLGYFGPGQMVPEFEKAAFALNKGQYTEAPIKTQFGWHIIQKEDERDAKPPEFDQVKDQIRQVLLREKYLSTVEELRKDLEPEILDADLKTKYDEISAKMKAAEEDAKKADQ